MRQVFGGRAHLFFADTVRTLKSKIMKKKSSGHRPQPVGPVPDEAMAAVREAATRQNITNQLVNVDVDYVVLPSPIKSSSDPKEYRVIRLANGLTACLISDPDTVSLNSDSETEDDSDNEISEYETESDEDSLSSQSGSDDSSDDGSVEEKLAAAALCVNVGSFSDPKEIPGMAHFVEHMVFMGSEKYPQENDFDAYLSKRGGSSNASTDYEHTTFYFDCLEKHLYGALDRFAHFFVAPLMEKDAMQREREAIESEFQMAISSDMYRKEQLIGSFARDNTPPNIFAWGNLETLKERVNDDDLYKRAHEFRLRHYSAHRMTVAVQARLPLDTIQTYVLQCFGSVPSNGQEPDDFSACPNNLAPFDTDRFAGRLSYVKPAGDLLQVDLTWALPSLIKKYQSKPHEYISWLLGYEGKGSIFSYLRKRVWALSITTGTDQSDTDYNSLYTLFTVSVLLTNEGFKHLDEVVEAIFGYVNLMKEKGPQKRIYEEIRTIEETSFRFQEEESSSDTVEEVSESMHLYPSTDYLTGSQLYTDYDPVTISEIVNMLTPTRMNMIVFTRHLPSGVEFDQSEPWFGTEYTNVPISEDQLKRWTDASPKAEFFLPTPNSYLCTDFTLVNPSSAIGNYPVKIADKPGFLEVWFRTDVKFRLPQIFYRFQIINPEIVKSAKGYTMLDLMLGLMEFVFAEDAYPAFVAQLFYKLKVSDKGVEIKISGYSEKIHMLVDLLVKCLVDLENSLTNEIFIAIKEQLTKNYYNRLLKPGTLASEIRLFCLIDTYYTILDKYNALITITFDDFLEFKKQFTHALYVKCLVQGNVDEHGAMTTADSFMKTLNSQPIELTNYPKFHPLKVPDGDNFVRIRSLNIKDANSIVINYYQSDVRGIVESVMVELMVLMMEEPLFDQLRTKEQLGYHVDATLRDTYHVLGFSITVNSQVSKNTTMHVSDRINHFLKRFHSILADMSPEEFLSLKENLIQTKQCVDVHLKQEVARNWTEIIDDDYKFNRNEMEIEALRKVTYEDIKQWWNRHFDKDRKHNILSVQVEGSLMDVPGITEEDKQHLGSPLALEILRGDEKKNDIEDLIKYKSVATVFSEPIQHK